MNPSGIDRRQFLESSGQAAGVAVVAAPGVTMLVDPNGGWAMTLEAIAASDAQTLLQALRVIDLREASSDRCYAQVIAALDQDAKGDAAVAVILKKGVAGLDAAGPVPFAELSAGKQRKVLEAIGTTDFFQTIQRKAGGILHDDPLVEEAFGYDGETFMEDRFASRDLSDLGGLPDRPDEASPPIA